MARNLTNNDIPNANAKFTDTVTHDAKNAIEYVRTAGLFNGTTATTFNPNGLITRAQMATVAARWIEKQCAEGHDAAFCTAVSPGISFKDVEPSHWAAIEISKVSGLGIMTGVSADTFKPNDYLTRAQAVKVLNQLFTRQPKTQGLTMKFSDIPSNYWAFFEIQVASIVHEYTLEQGVEKWQQ
ncbi:S-layer homology domain-containing protein [Lysinibacillus parviboronicapiens]|uniref:S-layer homology domain-containing protein n=1 Tax=Lysinibacillus parviboronicapiens TaxID=436516 RepID=UPI0034DD1CD9